MNDTKEGTHAEKLVAERLALDFANTADWHAGDHPVESLTSYAELVAWSQGVGVLTVGQGRRLLEVASTGASDAAAVLARAIALREAIFRIFSAISKGVQPRPADLACLNAELSGAMGQARLIVTADGFDWDWAPTEKALDRMLWPVVYDAANLLTSDLLQRVGRCADEKCGWLFLDTSRNRSRRWCSMEDCGNRAKARRHYERTRLRGQSPGR